jgi:hypothetical protein
MVESVAEWQCGCLAKGLEVSDESQFRLAESAIPRGGIVIRVVVGSGRQGAYEGMESSGRNTV